MLEATRNLVASFSPGVFAQYQSLLIAGYPVEVGSEIPTFGRHLLMAYRNEVLMGREQLCVGAKLALPCSQRDSAAFASSVEHVHARPARGTMRLAVVKWLIAPPCQPYALC